MSAWVLVMTAVLTAAASVAASSGFWAFMQRKDSKRTQTDLLLMGFAYGRIVDMGFQFIERGWITKDEYEDYRKLLYEPYIALGGNGVAKRIVDEVSLLPLRSRAKYAEIINDAKARRPDSYDPAPVDLHAGVLVE